MPPPSTWLGSTSQPGTRGAGRRDIGLQQMGECPGTGWPRHGSKCHWVTAIPQRHLLYQLRRQRSLKETRDPPPGMDGCPSGMHGCPSGMQPTQAPCPVGCHGGGKVPRGEGAQLPRGDIQLLAQERCEDPQMYTLRLGYFGKGRNRSCDRSWGLQVWTAGSCLSDSDPLPDLGETREPPLCWGQLSHPFPLPSRLFNDDENQVLGSDVAGDNRGNRGQSPGLGANPTPTLWHRCGRPPMVPRAVLEVHPIFFTAVPPPVPALWLG